MIRINPRPDSCFPPISFPVKPEKDESLKSWLAKKNYQRKYYIKLAERRRSGFSV